MQTLRIGYDQAIQCLIVGKAVSRIQQQQNGDKVEAISFLTRDLNHYLQNWFQDSDSITYPHVLHSSSLSSNASSTISTIATASEDSSLKHPLYHGHAIVNVKAPNTPILCNTKKNVKISSTIKPTQSSSSSHKLVHTKKSSLQKMKPPSLRKRKDDAEDKVASNNKEVSAVEQVKRSTHTCSAHMNSSTTPTTATTTSAPPPNTNATRGKRSRDDVLVTNNIPSSTFITATGSTDGGSGISPKRRRLDSI